MDQLWPFLIGPYGALAIAVCSAVILWREHRKADDKRDNLLERQMQVNEKNADNVPILTATVKDALSLLGERRQTSRPVPRERRSQ